MKTNPIKRIFAALAAGAVFAAAFTSCEKWLEEESFDFTQPDDIEDSDAGATQWLIGTYSKLGDNLFNSNTFPMVWIYDEDYLTGPDWAFGNIGAGNFQNNGYINGMWEGLYNLIHRCNYAAYEVGRMQHVDDRLRTAICGEMKFLKAWSYFQLVRAFGPVPLRKESISETGDRNVPRSSVGEVYAYIIELLEDAQTECYKNTDKDFVQGRVSAGTAVGLLAKVYATIASGAMPEGTRIWVRGGKPWSGEGTDKAYTDPQKIEYRKQRLAGYEEFDPQTYWELAYKKAEQVMSGEYGAYELVPYDRLWKRSERYNGEYMWNYDGFASDKRYCEYFSYHICGIENSSGLIADGMWYGGRDHWYKMVESKDLRVAEGIRHRWQRTWDLTFAQYYPNTQEWNRKVENKEPPFDDGLSYACPQFDTYYLAYPTKYADRTDRTVQEGDSFWPLLRYADVVLIYAEAYAEAVGTTDGKALAALNDVRNRSGATPRELGGQGGIGDLVDFRSSVLEERAIEFLCEGDRRWDLIRWGIYVDVMNAIGGNDEIGIYKGRQQKHTLFPIPSSEMDANASITENNPGWN